MGTRSDQRSNNKKAFLFSLVLCVTSVQCDVCQKKDEVGDLPADIAKIFKTLFGDLPKAKVTRPLDAIPGDLEWLVTSPDPEAWRAWAAEQPFVKAMMKTPLFEDLRMSRTWLALDGLRYQAAQAAALTGASEDKAALWRGPTALGAVTRESEDESEIPHIVIVKAIDVKQGAVVRFAAAFAMLGQAANKEGPGKVNLSEHEVEGVKVHTLERRNQKVVFALFKNLLIAGNDETLVDRCAALAVDKPKKSTTNPKGDRPASDSEIPLPTEAVAGIHIAHRLNDPDLFGAIGVDTIGVSLVPDPKAPIVVRRPRGSAPESNALSLLNYAPESAFLAWVDGVKPSEELLTAGQTRLLGSEETDGSLEIGKIDVQKEIISKLSPGVALVFGASSAEEQPGAPAVFVAFAHRAQKDALEPPVRKLLGELTSRPVERTILSNLGNAILLSSSSGPSAALTDDALLVALTPDRLRVALAAGSAKAPSLKDRKGVDLAKGASGGIYVDLTSGAAFLTGFYRRALANDSSVAWQEVEGDLGSTFDALGRGGALFARMSHQGERSEGALRVIP